jgi:putative hydrolase of the HAD superfamily
VKLAPIETGPGALRAVTFDVTGTLIRPRDLGGLYREVFRRHGLAVSQPPAEVAGVIRKVWQELACRTDGSTDRFAGHPEGARGWWRRFGERVADHLGVGAPTPFAAAELYDRFARPDTWQVYPDAPPALARLRERGIRLAVVSNWDERLPKLLAGLGVAGLVDAVVYSAEVGYEKPDPRIFLAALDRLGHPDPEETAHVGDRLREDVEGAAALGMQAILLDRQARTRKLPEPATALIHTLEDLPLPGPSTSSGRPASGPPTRRDC